MEEQVKRKMIRNYFKPFPKWAVIMAFIGILALYADYEKIIDNRKLTIIFSLIFVGIAGLGIYFYNHGKPSDQQMDAWLEEDLKILNNKALKKTGIDESELVSESVQVTGPRLWDIAGAEALFKKGKDNVLRFTPIGVSIINFTQNQLLNYTCILDITTGNPLNESTDEYFYKDVVSVSTKSESKTVNIKNLGNIQLNSAETFTLTTSGGTSLSVLLRDPSLIEKMGGGEIPTTRAEKAIQTVRKMLREKKI